MTSRNPQHPDELEALDDPDAGRVPPELPDDAEPADVLEQHEDVPDPEEDDLADDDPTKRASTTPRDSGREGIDPGTSAASMSRDGETSSGPHARSAPARPSKRTARPPTAAPCSAASYHPVAPGPWSRPVCPTNGRAGRR